MSILKQKTINATVFNVDFIEASGDEVTLELGAWRSASHGRKGAGETRLRIRLVIHSYGVLKMTQAGRQGLEKLADIAQSKADGLRRTIDGLGKAAA